MNDKAWVAYEHGFRKAQRDEVHPKVGPQTTETREASTLEATEKLIRRYCDALCDFMIAKNRKYNNSALNPVRFMSKLPADEGIKLRADDKISRFSSSDKPRRNDVVDIPGYLGLYCIAMWLKDDTDLWLDYMDMVD